MLEIAASASTLGATVTGVRLNALSGGEWRAIEDAFHAHAVLVFAGANLTEPEHIAFSRRFGPLERTLSQRARRQEISLLSNVAKDGSIARPDDALGRFLKGNRSWHTDSSFKAVGAKVSLLRALEVPDSGGDTEWADMRAAWDVLDMATRKRLDGLVAVHSYAYSQGLIGGTALLTGNEWDALPPVEHPVVRVHPVTGRRSLYVGRHASHILGMDVVQGRALLQQLTEDACQPPRIFRHRWRAGDLVAWDNRCVLHRGHPWPFEQPRVMRRTTVAGDGDNPWSIRDRAGEAARA